MMKKIFYKKWITTLFICQLALLFKLNAEEIMLPIITKPAELLEGTETKLSESQIQELLPWAHDTKIFLTDLLDNIQTLNSKGKYNRLVEGIEFVVKESSPKNNELLMRYILNRSLVLNNLLAREMLPDAVGTIDTKIQILKKSVEMAIKYFDQDMGRLDKKVTPNFAEFGINYFIFLNEINKSIVDASAQYTLYRIALDWIKWDLNRDLNNKSFAPTIVKIHNSLKLYKEMPGSDLESIAQIRQLKYLSQQVIKSLGNSIKVASTNEKIKIGDNVVYYHTSQGVYLPAKVIALQSEENMVSLRLANNEVKANVKIYNDDDTSREIVYALSGCGDNVCVGESMYLLHPSGDTYEVTILGRTLHQDKNLQATKFHIAFHSGDLDGRTGGGWNFNAKGGLIKKSGCFQNLCVGDKVINKVKNASANIVGIKGDNTFMLLFTSSEIANKFGTGWTYNNLIKEGL